MPKRNLRSDSARTQTEQLINQLNKQLLETPELYRNDLLKGVKQYKEDLITHEFSENTIKKYVRNARWFIENYCSHCDSVLARNFDRWNRVLFYPKEESNKR